MALFALELSRGDREALNALTAAVSQLTLEVRIMALKTDELKTAFSRLSAELAETATAINGLKDKVSSGDSEAQAVIDDAVAKLNAASDTLDSLQA